MSAGSWAQRLVSAFVRMPAEELAPAGGVPARREGSGTDERAPTLAVLARTGAGQSAARALALTLCRRHRVPAALVLHWAAVEGDVPPPAVAVPAATRIAGLIRREELAAHAQGRLAFARLPTAGEAAVAAATSLLGRVAAPAVLLVEGPRPAVLDPLLAGHDAIVLAYARDRDELLEAAARERAEVLGVPVGVLREPGGPLAAVVNGGLVVPPSLRRAADAVLEDLR